MLNRPDRARNRRFSLYFANVREGFVAGRLGFATAPTVREALEQARDVVGSSSSVTCYHWPPIFLCDVG